MPERGGAGLSLAELARDLAAESDVDAVWQRVVEASVRHIDGAEHAGITQVGRGSVSTPACTGDLVYDVDRYQYATGEGPCLSAALHRKPVVQVGDLRADGRWPRFSAAVAGLQVRSMLSLQLYTRRDSIGALNVYSSATDAFSDESVRTGTILAAQAAVAAEAAIASGSMQIALRSRDVIRQAEGMLMERNKLAPNAAFDVLIRASQGTTRKLIDIASRLTETGELVTD